MKIEGMLITPHGEETIKIIVDGLATHLCNDFYPFKNEMEREVIMKYAIREAKKEAKKMMAETKAMFEK